MPPVKMRGDGRMAKSPKKTLLRLLSYMRGYVPVLIVVLVCIILSSLAQTIGTRSLGTLVDEYILPMVSSGSTDFSPLASYLLKIACIFGVGINVNQRTFTSNAPNPVSLSAITGQEEDITELLNRIVEAFCKYYAMLLDGRYADISDLYHAALYRRHGFHAYRDANGIFDAAIVEVENDGHLVLRDKDCHFRRYAFKEVEFLV